jgi:hypothetical protein
MSMPLRRPRTRAVQPQPEVLEARQLLSETITGMDSKGDAWTLQLVGPGALRVIKQNGPNGQPAPLNSLTDINMIEVAGADPFKTKLIGTVRPSPGSDGRVFFQQLIEIGGRATDFAADNGLLAIDMPNFWLGNTSGSAPSSTSPSPSISIPDGVVDLRFGGADTTFGPQSTSTSTTTATPNNINITLGVPRFGGTSVIVNQMISSTTPGMTSSSGTPSTPVQNQITLTVDGRLNLFQANQIVGDPNNPSSGTVNGGGTVVVAQTDLLSGVTGPIGTVRVGGDATDFTVQTVDRIANFYVGGNTNNVFLIAPNGAREILFGHGMNNVSVYTHVVQELKADAGALNSNVNVDRALGRAWFGGDVVNTHVASGYQQLLSQSFFSASGQPISPTNPGIGGTTSQTLPTNPPAQDGGGMTVLVAGNITNSTFAASVQPFNNTLGDNDLKLPSGMIRAKVEGTIDNSTATPNQPMTAFYANSVQLKQGPVVPPAVPQAPFPRMQYHRGQGGLRPTATTHGKGVAKTSATSTAKVNGGRSVVSRSSLRAAQVGVAVPRGPLAAQRTRPNSPAR